MTRFLAILFSCFLLGAAATNNTNLFSGQSLYTGLQLSSVYSVSGGGGGGATNPPTMLGGIKYWWRSSDLVANAPVTNWIDQIQFSTWTNGNNATRPTNSAAGVHFLRSASQVLTNSVAVSMSGGSSYNNTIWYIVKLDSSNPFQDWLGNASLAPMLVSEAKQPSYYDGTTTVKGGALPLSQSIDVAFVSSPDSTHTLTIYTNGILSNASTAAAIQTTFGMNLMGGDSADGFYDGSVQELAIYTNSVATALQVSNLHYYRTNLYGGSP